MNIGEPHYTREISEVNLKEAFPIRRESIYAQIEEGKKELAGRGAKQSRRPAKVRRASGRTNPSKKKNKVCGICCGSIPDVVLGVRTDAHPVIYSISRSGEKTSGKPQVRRIGGESS